MPDPTPTRPEPVIPGSANPLGTQPPPGPEVPPLALTTDDPPDREGAVTPSFLAGQVTATYQPSPAAESRDGSANTPSEPPPPSIPGYAIESVLGRGGMGLVYKARHLALKRSVALKMFRGSGHAGPGELARFRIEAEAVARLQHPNIVQIHEIGEAGGHPFRALEFVEGGNLGSKLGGKPLPAPEAAKLVETLARAMQLAHSRNVVHRDLKPANILLTTDGTPKITDFGLARQLDSDSGETQAGAVMGTPSYMAPEQASGRGHEAGPAADVYAPGAILYDCLTGRPPFKGRTVVETLDMVRMREPVPPSHVQPGVPLDLETICLKCLCKEPEKRYASAAELADELVRYQKGSRSWRGQWAESSGPSSGGNAIRWWRGRRQLWWWPWPSPRRSATTSIAKPKRPSASETRPWARRMRRSKKRPSGSRSAIINSASANSSSPRPPTRIAM